MIRYISLVILFLLIPPQILHAQCSDAGACAVGAGAHDAADDEHRHALSARYAYGGSGSPDDLRFHTVILEGDVQLFTRSRLQARIPWTRIEGPLGAANGIGDVTLLWDQLLWSDDAIQLRGQAGGKIAIGDVNVGGLPQAYQPGLGTNDLLFGLSFAASPWNFAVVYQHSPGRSENADSRLRRGDDLLARAGYSWQLANSEFGLDILAIKRLSESSVLFSALDPEYEGEDYFIDVPDSDQLQINLVASAITPLSDSVALMVLAAVPMLKRDVNFDGLTRAFTLSVGASYSL